MKKFMISWLHFTMNSFKGVLGFSLLFRNTYFKWNFWMAASGLYITLTLHGNFKVYSLLTLIFFLFCLTNIYPKCWKNFPNFKILCAPQKKQWYCFFCGAPRIQHFQDAECPDFRFFCFDLPLFTQRACVKVTLLEILGAPRTKQWYCFVRGALFM